MLQNSNISDAFLRGPNVGAFPHSGVRMFLGQRLPLEDASSILDFLIYSTPYFDLRKFRFMQLCQLWCTVFLWHTSYWLASRAGFSFGLLKILAYNFKNQRFFLLPVSFQFKNSMKTCYQKLQVFSVWTHPKDYCVKNSKQRPKQTFSIWNSPEFLTSKTKM